MRFAAAWTFAVALQLTAALVADPGAALVQARTLIAAQKYTEASALLAEAMRAIDALPDPAERTRGRAAAHFYAAAAESGLGNESKAREHLQTFFRTNPNARIDASKYDRRFVALFERVRSDAGSGEQFEALYPGYAAARAPANAPDYLGDRAAVEILGSLREKREWKAIATGEERARFVAEFWRARDRSPQTEGNEFRDTFLRRIAFADAAFAVTGQAGSLSDRGRVFAILGEPALVRRRALNSSDPIQAFNVGSVGIADGTIEYWFYGREQLPVAQPQPTVTFRFVSHQGIGEFVLQKDGLAVNTLNAAANVAARE